MTVVVTGAAGHLGGNLCRALLKQGEAVRAAAHRDRRALDGLDVSIVSIDLADPASLRKAFAGAEKVYHLAGKISIQGDPDGSVHAANVVGARNAAEAALEVGVERFVHVSSVHAFDLRRSARVDEDAPRAGPNNYAYDQSKAQGEDAVRGVIERGLDATMVNPTGIIGPFDFKPSRMGQVFLDLAARRMPALVRGGFDFVDVRDVANSTIAAAKNGITGRNYLLAGHHVTIKELAHVASAITGTPAPRTVLPIGLAGLGVPFAAWRAKRHGRDPKFTKESLGALRHCPTIDDARARQELGHAPRPLVDSIRDTYAWFQEHGGAAL